MSTYSVMKSSLLTTAIAAIFAFLFIAPNACANTNQAILTFNTPVNPPGHQCEQINYQVDPRTARFFVYAPSHYTRSQAFGLIVFISPGETLDALPDGWAEVLERHKLLFVCPQDAGNNSRDGKMRLGRAVLGALEMMNNYNVDKSRVYAAGLSGGARVACDLGLAQSDVFSGTIQSCGTDFYQDVQRRYATSDVDTLGNHYGVFPATASEVAQARARTRFVLITGSGDFRRGNILDIYYGGFAAGGFRSKLIDVPGMGHQTCSGATLEQALDFLR